MDKRTRVLNAMNQLNVDHVPVGMWFHFCGNEGIGQECIDAHLRYYKETDLDFVKVMSDSFCYPLEGVTELSDLSGIEPLSADHPYIRGQIQRAGAIVEAMGRERCIFYNVSSPFTTLRSAVQALGISEKKLMKFILSSPDIVIQALDVIAESVSMLAERLITEAKCDGVYYCVQGAEQKRFTEQQYRTYIRPSDLKALEHANIFSEYNILHMCGWDGVKNQLDLWKDYPAKVVNWAVFVEGLSLKEGREFFGGRTVLGGFQTYWNRWRHVGVIYRYSKEKIFRYTRELIENTGSTGLLLGGDCTLDSKIDRERIHWVVEASRSISLQ